MVYEDLFVKKYNCPPMLVLGTEGTFGFLILSLMLVPLYWIPVGPNTTFVNSPNRVVEVEIYMKIVQFYCTTTIYIDFLNIF